MKTIFDHVSFNCSKIVTESYSTSFALATKMLASSIRSDIYNIYGFVRFADEIVDTFHDYDKKELFDNFENALEDAIANKISLNPILNSFQHTYHKYDIPHHLVEAFMKSMRMDLTKKVYTSYAEYEEYIYGSADVVGLMCLCVFVNGDIVQSQVYLNGSFSGFTLRLEEGINTIEFQALNQGSSGPNTAELHVYDEKGFIISAKEWNLLTGRKATIIVNKD